MAITETQASNYTLTFGKFKGKALEDVPTSYLSWLEGQDWVEKKWPSLLESIAVVLRWRTRHDEHF